MVAWPFFLIFFFYRYHLSFDDKEAEDDDSEVEDDDSEVELDESCRPQFSDINKASGFLDKELEASGFTRKDQVDMEKVQSFCQIFFNMFFSTSFGNIICFFKWYNSLHNYYLWTYLYISDQRFTYSLNISFDWSFKYEKGATSGLFSVVFLQNVSLLGSTICICPQKCYIKSYP